MSNGFNYILMSSMLSSWTVIETVLDHSCDSLWNKTIFLVSHSFKLGACISEIHLLFPDF
jgi:hypothetical protein